MNEDLQFEVPDDFVPEFSMVNGNPTMTVRDGVWSLALTHKLRGDPAIDGQALHSLRALMWKGLEMRRLGEECKVSKYWKAVS